MVNYVNFEDISMDKMYEVCYNENVSVRTSKGLTMIETTSDGIALMQAMGEGYAKALLGIIAFMLIGWAVDKIVYGPVREAESFLVRK